MHKLECSTEKKIIIYLKRIEIKKMKTTAHRCEHTGFSSSSFTLQTRERNKAPK